MFSILLSAVSILFTVLILLMLWYYFKSFIIVASIIFIAFAVICMAIGAYEEIFKEVEEQEQD